MDTLPPGLGIAVGDALTIGRRSARRPRVEVLTNGVRRRSWTVEQKREIVEESLGPEVTPTEVARKHGIGTGQLYTWRQQLLSVADGVVTRTSPRFAAVELPAPLSTAMSSPDPERSVPFHSAAAPRAEGVIEIVLPGGVLVRVDAQVDGRALRRVLGALEGR